MIFQRGRLNHQPAIPINLQIYEYCHVEDTIFRHTQIHHIGFISHDIPMNCGWYTTNQINI